MRVVLDTNVLLSGFFFGGVPGRILEAWRDGKVRLVLSSPILDEYRTAGSVLELKYGGTDFPSFIALLALNCELMDAVEFLNPQVSRDRDDDKFLACAHAGRVRIVISGDEDLLTVTGWSGIEVVKPRAFVDRFLPK
ncbi:MAG: putative toxin-antitoxin system toxin component, PIN family [Rhodothermales bacterium]